MVAGYSGPAPSGLAVPGGRGYPWDTDADGRSDDVDGNAGSTSPTSSGSSTVFDRGCFLTFSGFSGPDTPPIAVTSSSV